MSIQIVNTEHSNTAPKLSKPIKELKIITQQPEKTKTYTEPTAADRMLSSLTLRDLSIINTLFEITNKFK